jgi:hypothetical protein
VIKGLVAAAFAAAAITASPAFADIGINLYGLSYHFERDRARELGAGNEANWGAGLRWRSNEGGWFADIGAYRDSGRNTAKLAGAGYLWELGERWRLGGAVTGLHSDTYNQGRAFVAVIPVLAYEAPRYTLNFTFFPKIVGMNDINTLGVWLTLNARRPSSP